jgi:hypothetical protein
MKVKEVEVSEMELFCVKFSEVNTFSGFSNILEKGSIIMDFTKDTSRDTSIPTFVQ